MKPGYKQTEIGVIPEDWDVVCLSDAFEKLEAGVSVNSDESKHSKYQILKTSAVHGGNVDLKESKPVVRRDVSRLKCAAKNGSIIISRMNTPLLVGECGYVAETRDNVFLPDRLWQVENHKKDEYDFVWLNYLLNTKEYKDKIRGTATGTSNSMKNISKERLLDIKIAKPKLSEQNAISMALSNLDGLIYSLKSAVAKKTAIKQGAMEELLTGKQRLAGFSKSWQKYCIGDFGEFTSGTCFPLMFQGMQAGKYPFYKVSDFGNPGNERMLKRANNYISQEIADRLGCKTIPAYAIVVAKIGAAIFLERKKLTTVPCCIDNNMMAFITNDSGVPEFMWYLLQSIRLGDYVEATALPSLSGTTICRIERFLPSEKKEQHAIAEVLSNMDSEIEKLEQKLAKARQLKQGMMQQLLTGKIRLV